eukprot:2417539-Prymnesium_polylepis.1
MVVSGSRTIAVAKSSISTLRGLADERASTSWTGRNPVVASPVGAVSPRRAAAAAMWVSKSCAGARGSVLHWAQPCAWAGDALG